MNGLAGLSIIAIFALGFSAVIAVNNIRHNEEKIAQAKKAKEVVLTVKKSDIDSQAVKNYIKNVEYIPNVSLNALNLKAANIADQSLITKFHNAMEYAVIKENIRKPTCGDLARTGLISLKECDYIANKKGLYVNIKSGNIEISNISNMQETDTEPKLKSFVHMVKIMNGEEYTNNINNNPNKNSNQQKENSNKKRNNAFSVSIVSSTIAQTINTDNEVAKNIVKKEKIYKNVQNAYISKIKQFANTLLTMQENKNRYKENISINEKQDDNIKLKPVLPEESNKQSEFENFKNSFYFFPQTNKEKSRSLR